jgi:hypothetical protein
MSTQKRFDKIITEQHLGEFLKNKATSCNSYNFRPTIGDHNSQTYMYKTSFAIHDDSFSTNPLNKTQLTSINKKNSKTKPSFTIPQLQETQLAPNQRNIETQTESFYFMGKNLSTAKLGIAKRSIDWTDTKMKFLAKQAALGSKNSATKLSIDFCKSKETLTKLNKEIFSPCYYMNPNLEKQKLGFHSRLHSFGCQAQRFSDKKFFDQPNNPLGPGEYQANHESIGHRQDVKLNRTQQIFSNKNKYAEYNFDLTRSIKRMKQARKNSDAKIQNRKDKFTSVNATPIKGSPVVSPRNRISYEEVNFFFLAKMDRLVILDRRGKGVGTEGRVWVREREGTGRWLAKGRSIGKSGTKNSG